MDVSSLDNEAMARDMPAIDEINEAPPRLASPHPLPSLIAIHEASHVVINCLFAIEIESVTIIPNQDFAGMVRGPGTDPDASRADLVAAVGARCKQAAVLFSHGESRLPGEAWISNAQQALISLLAGIEGERLARPGTVISGEGSSDYQQAGLYARTFCVEPDAEIIANVLVYARSEAHYVLKRYWHAVIAIAKALDDRGTLAGEEVDTIIAKADADFTLDLERKRREAWEGALKRAKNTLRAFSPILEAGK